MAAKLLSKGFPYTDDMKILLGIVIAVSMLVVACESAAYLGLFPAVDWRPLEALTTPAADALKMECSTRTTPGPGVTPTPYPPLVSLVLTARAETGATPECRSVP